MLKALASKIKYLSMAALIAIVVLVYYPGLSGSFFFDDENNIVNNDALQISDISLSSLVAASKSGIASPLGRPVSLLSFALNYHFSGFSPFAFKATNLVIHCLNGLLVFFIALYLIRATRQKLIAGDSQLLAGFVAAAWLLHPIQLTSVLYVVQRMASLSALFLFAAVFLHIMARQREKPDYTGIALLILAWAVLWPLSILSKESGILFPGFIAAYELIIRRHTHGRLDRLGTFIFVLTGVAIASAGIYLLTPYANWLWQGYDLRPFTLYERLLTEARVIWMYLGLIFLPHQEAFALYHDDLRISSSLLSPWTTLPALIGLGGLAGVAWWARIRVPLLAFAIAWFLIGHSLESTVLPLEIAHEHRNYVALFGILFLPIAAWPNTNNYSGNWRTASIAVLIAALAYFALNTALRAHQYGDEVRRTQIEAMYHPASARTQFEAGLTLARGLESEPKNSFTYSFAKKHFERAGTLDPTFKSSWLGLIQLNCLSGRPVEKTWVDELAKRLQQTPFGPADRNLFFNLKEMAIAHKTCLERKDIQRVFSAAFSNPTVSSSVLAILHSWHADYLLLRENDIPSAKKELAESLRLVPSNTSNQFKWAQLILLEGHKAEAIQLLKNLNSAPMSPKEKKASAKLLACLEGTQAACGEM